MTRSTRLLAIISPTSYFSLPSPLLINCSHLFKISIPPSFIYTHLTPLNLHSSSFSQLPFSFSQNFHSIQSEMTAGMSSLLRIMTEYKKDDDKAHCGGDLVTRDFLGGRTAAKELDLDLKVPSGWERRLDLLSGETYLEKSAPPRRELHDLNLPPPSPAALDASALDLKLLLPSCPRPAGAYQSVCTLDKVRSALERAGRVSETKARPQPQRSDGSASPSSSTTSTSIKRRSDQETDGPDSSAGLIAAGCPSCLMYVLISKGNPRCPRCGSHVPAQATVVSKKPRIDLNSL